MRIVIFGSEKCKYCKKQIEYISGSFNSSDWLYLDVFKDKEALDIAEDIDANNLPTILLLNDRMQKVHQKEGTMPADEIFLKINKDVNSIPISNKNKKQVLASKKLDILISYMPSFNIGDLVEAKSFNGKKIKSFHVVSVERVNPEADKIQKRIVADYMSQGGRKNTAYLIRLSEDKT